jgi:predicted O-methyltransferase YrrM
MDSSLFSRVDDFLVSQTQTPDPVLQRALQNATDASLPAIQVAAVQGKMLFLLARMTGARRILEIGTLGGFSGIWMARALPADGKLVTLELDDKHADVALKNFALAGVSDRVELIRGPALQSLSTLHARGEPKFDLVFVDADKLSAADYFNWAADHTRPGGVIIVDNVVRSGEVINEHSADANVPGVRRLLAMLRTDTRVDASALQTVGSKGYDGFAIAVVK